MTTLFTSDTHFGHKRIIELCHRPFNDVEHMDECIIMNWNHYVTQKDTVFVLGDFSFHGKAKTLEIFKRLNGRKILIRGNHDEQHSDKLPWEAVHDFFVFRQDKISVVLSHYPFLSWRHMQKGAFHLHGHCHGGLVAPVTRREDVGVDSTFGDFRPRTFEDVVKELENRELYECDGHVRHQA